MTAKNSVKENLWFCQVNWQEFEAYKPVREGGGWNENRSGWVLSLMASLIQQTVIKDEKREWGHMLSGRLVMWSLEISVEKNVWHAYAAFQHWQFPVLKRSYVQAIYAIQDIFWPCDVNKDVNLTFDKYTLLQYTTIMHLRLKQYIHRSDHMLRYMWCYFIQWYFSKSINL